MNAPVVIALRDASDDIREQVAVVLFEGMAAGAPEGWPTMKDAREEVASSLASDRLSLVALNDQNNVIGWIGGISSYNGNVFELHPLVVKQDVREQGIGRLLVAALEASAREAGAVTLFLGTDDEVDRTSLFGKNLYPDPLVHLAAMQNLRAHPFGFYIKVGFAVVGVVPDANGFGKPDILMAKRIRQPLPHHPL